MSRIFKLFIQKCHSLWSKFYKHYEDTIVNFEKLSEPILIKYIQKDSDLDTAQAKDLIKRCSSNYTLCLLELDKLKIVNKYLVQENRSLRQQLEYKQKADFAKWWNRVKDIPLI